jgi:hypothetical protein
MRIERVFRTKKISLPDWWAKDVAKKKNTAKANAAVMNSDESVTDSEDVPDVDFAFASSDQGYSFFKYDTAATIHICKDRHRFISLMPATRRILHGNTESMATGNGTVVLNVRTPFGTKSVQLDNVFYVSGFHFNLVSASKLEKQDYWIHARRRCLVDSKDNPIIQLFPYQGMYTIEDPDAYDTAMATSEDGSKVPRGNSSKVQRVTTATIDKWHERLEHVSKEILLYLEESSIGVKLSSTKFNREGDLCSPCIKANIRQQISRVPVHKGDYPFEKVHFDLVHLHKAFNADRYLLHFYCAFSGFHATYTLQSKDQQEFIDSTKHFLALTTR